LSPDTFSVQLKCKTFQSKVTPARHQIRGLLLRGIYSDNGKLNGFCQEPFQREEHLWTFTQVEGIEQTNNTVERAIRPAVIYRKLSFGTQSSSGSRYLERMLSVSETCRLQNRNAYQYLIKAMQAAFSGAPAPPQELKDQ
jgi:hypothetical protein